MDGKKYDDGKLRWDLLPYETVEKIVEVLTFGAQKYGDNNWQGVESYKYLGALMRHLVAWIKGEDFDKESGLHHLAHAGCNILFLLWQNGR